jgi:hypothetical protein
MTAPSPEVGRGPASARGYADPGYAASLAEFGEPLVLPRSDGWLLRRPIPGSDAFDAANPYPLFACRDGDGLADDLRELDGRLVSVTAVADPFGGADETHLRRAFHRVVPFKTHYVADLAEPVDRFASRRHLESGRRALERMTVDVCADPSSELDTWVELYDHLIARAGLRGIKRFSRAAFARQLALPGLVMFRARADGRVLGLDLWYVHGEVATGHLVALREEAYPMRAGYGLKLFLLRHFREHVRFVNLGGSAGLAPDGGDGLAAFKRGWSNTTRTAFLCGRVGDPTRYAELARGSGHDGTDYFPAYRRGEF